MSPRKSPSPRMSPRKSPSPRMSPRKSPSRRMSQSKKDKYANRPSPAFPAQDHCGDVMEGNDGLLYESRANKNGVCSWKKLPIEQQPSPM